MDRSLELAFRNVTPSVELKALIQKCLARLEQRCGHIIECSVTMELISDPHHSGNVPNVIIDIQVPGETLLIRNQNGRSRDVRAAVRHAFDSAVRQIEEYRARKLLQAELWVHQPAIKKVGNSKSAGIKPRKSNLRPVISAEKNVAAEVF
jgi:ribosome-associated translation inhibitor RaiA